MTRCWSPASSAPAWWRRASGWRAVGPERGGPGHGAAKFPYGLGCTSLRAKEEVTMRRPHLTRRALLASGASFAAAAALPSASRAQGAALPAEALRRIPSSGEMVPSVGLGTWITFNVGDDPVLQAECNDVMAAFFAAGGRVIDSSPMYGSAQAVIGRGLAALGTPPDLFAADKVWTSGDGPAQMEDSRRHWGVRHFD